MDSISNEYQFDNIIPANEQDDTIYACFEILSWTVLPLRQMLRRSVEFFV